MKKSGSTKTLLSFNSLGTKKIFYIITLLVFIFIGEASLASIIFLSHNIGCKNEYAFFIVFFLQLICSIPQASISDCYCRRKSLIFSFCSISIAQFFFHFASDCGYWFFLSSLVIYGLFGNIPAIARAALVDTGLYNKFRLSVGLSTVAIALGWVVTLYAAVIFSSDQIFYAMISLCILAIILGIFGFEDLRDKDFHLRVFSIKNEIDITGRLLNSSLFYRGLLGYLLAEIGFYYIFSIDKGNFSSENVQFIVSTFAIGYCVGVVFQSMLKSSDRRLIIYGTIIAVFSFILITVSQFFHFENYVVKILLNSLFSMGYGVFIPSLFSIISVGKSAHQQGKIQGLIDSTDTLAIMIAVAGLTIFKIFELNNIYLYVVSLIFILFSSYFLRKASEIKNKSLL